MNPLRQKYEDLRELRPGMRSHGENHWMLDADVAVRTEKDVRRAFKKLGKSQRFSAKLIDRSVVSDVFAATTSSNPLIVNVYTEHGIGDPFQYADIYKLFDKVAAELAKDPMIESAYWDSVNPGLHRFYLTPRLVA
jgi:hypothetical protein